MSRKKLSKLETDVLRAFGRRKSGSFWTSFGHRAWRVPGSKRCSLCRDSGIEQARCHHPIVPTYSAEAIKKELADCGLDFSVMHVGGHWHAIVAPHGQLLTASTGGYSMALSEVRALMLALVEADRRHGLRRSLRPSSPARIRS